MKTKRQIIEELLEEYRTIRQNAQNDAARRRTLIAEKAPIYLELETRILDILRQARLHMDEPDWAGNAVRALRAEAEEQLAHAGYTPEDMQPNYRCKLCKDTGYVGEPVKSFCSCFEKRLHQMQIQQEDLRIAPDHNFESYNLSIFPTENGQRDQMQKAKKWAEAFVNRNCSGKACGDVVLFGKSGLGKTFLLDCMISKCVENGRSAMKLSAFALGDLMRKKHMGQEEARFSMAQQVDVLGIDDLGTEPMLENVTVEYLFALICHRQECCKSTIITTNLSLQEFQKRYTERITTRLHGQGTIIQLTGMDVRFK